MNTAFHRSQTLLLTFVFFLYACGNGTPPAQSLTILPADCEVPISQQIPLTLSGSIDPNSQITWQTNLGSIVNNSQGFSASYFAPSIAGEAIIYAIITSNTSADPIQLSLKCQIVEQIVDSSNPLIAVAGASDATSKPYPIVISEVMGNPCGGLDQRKYNQYIELYNYGDQPVDVGGWWFYDEGDSGTPDQLIAWNQRQLIEFENDLIFDSTIIPAQGVAVILSPLYPQNSDITKMPYQFPTNTTILTVSTSDTLGDDYFGIIADQDGYDTVTLYIGGASVIETIVDTYGTPLIPNAYPVQIQDDYQDNIPTYLSECSSIERINPLLPDQESNWNILLRGSPGEVPYQ